MLDFLLLTAIYAAPLALIIGIYVFRRRRRSDKADAIHREAEEAGLTEPASLHPDIDLSLCCGSGACVRACPEKTVIGVVNGKAKLIDPTACIGHGACAAACPTSAISLVFGTEKRGVELPEVKPNFETNVPGLFIAGELGGMGLIRNAIEQGRQAMDGVIDHLSGPASAGMLDVLIVGAGPAGFSASLRAMEKELKYKTIEQDTFGGTVAHFPRGKLVMTQPATLPIIGKVKFAEVSKETLMEFWTEVREKTGLEVEYKQRLVRLTPIAGGFRAETETEQFEARSVLLAIGRRGTPRKLGIPGEDLPKVVYRMVDPAQYAGQDVIVIGGGDSALEAAASIAEETDARVTLAYRGDSFPRAKKKNRTRVETAAGSGRLDLRFNTTLIALDEGRATLQCGDETVEQPCDSAIICAGGVLPTKLLHEAGIRTVTKHGEA